MWTATRWRRRSPPRGGFSPATTGRDRRDAPLHRGDGGGDPRSLPRPPPALHRGVRPCRRLWTRSDICSLASTSATRRALLEQRGDCRRNAEAPASTSARRGGGAQERSIRRAARGASRGRKGAGGQPPSARAGWCSGPTRCSPATAEIFHKPADREAARRSCGSCPDDSPCSHSPPGALRAIGGPVVERFYEQRHLTMRPLTDRGPRPLSRPRRATMCSKSVGVLPGRRVSASICSRRSRAITPRSWGCRSFRCSPPCAVSAA